MPIQAKGQFPKPSTTYRDDGSNGRIPGRITIEEYRALKTMPRGDEALKLLQNVGLAVKPIMMKHNWRLPLLVEIYPNQQSLLGFNVNSGKKIALRLRHASNHNDFIDQESLIETMLHELAHNLRGPHDDIFFQHLDNLTKEWYELQSSSTGLLPGQGFLFGGSRLGGDTLINHLSPGQARLKAAEMAERRRRQAILMSDGGSGQRLGGSSRPSLQELASVRAEAAERRREITHNCPSSNLQLTQDAAKEQEEQEILHGIQVITIEDDEDYNQQPNKLKNRHDKVIKREYHSSDEDEVVVVEIKKSNKKILTDRSTSNSTSHAEPSNLVRQTCAAAALRHDLLGSSSNDILLHPTDMNTPDSSINGLSCPWNCQRCTLLNVSSSLVCQVCEEIRPGLSHWICQHCNHKMLGDYSQYWLCTQCGRMKTA